jgi:hypothetical protein
MAGKLIIVPNREIRSTTQTDKGRKSATIYSGKFEIVADVTDEGKVRISQEVLDSTFEVFDDSPGLAERLGVTEDDLDEAGV